MPQSTSHCILIRFRISHRTFISPRISHRSHRSQLQSISRVSRLYIPRSKQPRILMSKHLIKRPRSSIKTWPWSPVKTWPWPLFSMRPRPRLSKRPRPRSSKWPWPRSFRMRLSSKRPRSSFSKRPRRKRTCLSVETWSRSSVRMRFWLRAYLRRKFFSQTINIWSSVSLSSAHYQKERLTESRQREISDVSWDELNTLFLDQTKEVSVLIQPNVASQSRDSQWWITLI